MKTLDGLVFEDAEQKINICVLPPKERRNDDETVQMVAQAIKNEGILEDDVDFGDVAETILATGTYPYDEAYYDVYIETLPTV